MMAIRPMALTFILPLLFLNAGCVPAGVPIGGNEFHVASIPSETGDPYVFPPGVPPADPTGVEISDIVTTDNAACASSYTGSPGETGLNAYRWFSPSNGWVISIVWSPMALKSDATLKSAWTRWKSNDPEFTRCLVAGYEAQVERALAKGRPKSFEDVLRFEYNLNRQPGGRSPLRQRQAQMPISIRLIPGMQICVTAISNIRNIAVVASDLSCRRIVRDPANGALLFDSFLGRLSHSTKTPLAPPGSGATKILSWYDLNGFDNPPNKAYALIYPNSVNRDTAGHSNSNNGTSVTSTDLKSMPVLIAADDGEALNKALTSSDLTVLCDPHNTPTWTRCYTFSDAGVPTVQIPITLNGAGIDVPVTSTLSDLMTIRTGISWTFRESGANSADNTPSPAQLNLGSRINVRRWHDGRLQTVVFDAGDATALTFPLLMGDDVSW